MSIALISNTNSIPMVSSKEVAAKFGKKHYNVIKAYKSLVESTKDKAFIRVNFEADFFQSGSKEIIREFTMTRDGFMMLAMGFTGDEAHQWKVRFLQAFNEMEKKIPELLLEIERLRDSIKLMQEMKPKQLKESLKGKMCPCVTRYAPMFPDQEARFTIHMVMKTALEPHEQVDGLNALNTLSTAGNIERTSNLNLAIDFINTEPLARIKRWAHLPRKVKKIVNATGMRF